MKRCLLLSLLSLTCFSAFAQLPELVMDIYPGTQSSEVQWLTEMNGKLYFAAKTPAAGKELWVSDGTAAGTMMVKDIYPGPDSSGPAFLTVFNGNIYFMANDSIHGIELWVTDGTTAGTAMLKNIGPDGSPGITSSMPHGFTEYNGKLYFSATDYSFAGTGYELWVTDGTTTGTKMVKDIRPGNSGSDPRDFIVYNGKMYFSAADGTPDTELWVTDGTETGTVKLKDINPNSSGAPMYFKVYNGKLYFAANNGTAGTELWETDGTTAGTKLFKDIFPGSQSGYPRSMVEYKGLMYFIANDPTYANFSSKEIWVTDGTVGGTHIFNDFTPGGQGSMTEDVPVPYNDRLYYISFGGTQKYSTEVYSHDGTPAGVQLLKDINTATSTGSDPYLLHVYNGWLIFCANDGSSQQRQLWISDGTEDSTKMLLPASGTRANAMMMTEDFVNCNGSVYFTANHSSGVGNELYKLTLAPPVHIPNGVRSVPEIDGISIAPCPASDVLLVSAKHTSTYKLELSNAMGQVVLTTAIINGQGKILDISGYPSGLYILRVTGADGALSIRKVLKQ